MHKEAKAKVVASVWRAKFIQFLTSLAVLPRSIWKKRMNSIDRVKIASGQSEKNAAYNTREINFNPNPPDPLPLLLPPDLYAIPFSTVWVSFLDQVRW